MRTARKLKLNPGEPSTGQAVAGIVEVAATSGSLAPRAQAHDVAPRQEAEINDFPRGGDQKVVSLREVREQVASERFGALAASTDDAASAASAVPESFSSVAASAPISSSIAAEASSGKKAASQAGETLQTLSSLDQLPDGWTLESCEGGAHALPESLSKLIVIGRLAETGHYFLLVSSRHIKSAHHEAVRDMLLKGGAHIAREYQADQGLIGSAHSGSQGQRGASANSAQVRAIDALIKQALELKASDIHITMREDEAAIRGRRNGSLVLMTRWSPEYAGEIMRTMHVIADADTKDQLFSLTDGQSMMITRDVGEKVKLRVQTSPIYPSGMEMVMRILRSGGNTNPTPYDKLGYSPGHITMLNEMMRTPWGVTIFAGETGSGKSTSLFTMMTGIAESDPGAKLITVEDPPEYNMARWDITQIPVNRRRGQHGDPFTKALRDIMRMDLDMAMVGEIRDNESAAAMVNLNRTGHKIATTVHATNAFGIFERLLTLGIDLQTLTSRGFISGLVAQRLAPVLCRGCRTDYHPGVEFKIPGIHERIKAVTKEGDTIFVAGEGCDLCSGTGIKDQTVLAEMIIPDSQMLELLRNGNFAKAYEHWRSKRQPRYADISRSMVGMTMADHGIMKMRNGDISPDALERAVGPMTQDLESTAASAVEHEVATLLGLGPADSLSI